MESKKINQLATELAPELSDLTIIGDPTTGISKKITLSQMASLFTGTVEEYANVAAFPLVGAADTIYIALDTNVLYRWDTGLTSYVELSPNIINSLVFNDANGFDGTISLVGSVATLTITTALTQGSVGFIGASGALTQDNSNFYWDNSNKRLGINTNAPTTAFDVFGSGIIGRLNGTSTNNAFLGFASAGTNKWSIGNVQSDHRFRIYSEANASELVSVLQTGEFGIGIANPTTKLHIDGGASALIANLDANVSVAKSISFRSDNSNRINLEVSGTESGSNAGANFFIRRYSDAGALIDTPLTITRSTGAISLATELNGANATFNGLLTTLGTIRSTSYNTPTSGAGVEIDYGLTTDLGRIFAYDRTTSTQKNMQVNGVLNITSAGNIGVNITSPFTIAGTNLTINNTTDTAIQFGVNGVRTSQLYTASDQFRISTITGIPILFFTNDTRRGQFKPNGDFEVGFVNSANDAMLFSWAGASSYGSIQTYSSSNLALNPAGNQVLINTTTGGNGSLIIANGSNYGLTLRRGNTTDRFYFFVGQSSPYITDDCYIGSNNADIHIRAGASGGVKLSVGATSWVSDSDIRLKDKIGNIENALDSILKLETLKFNWKYDSELETKRAYFGLVAQNVQQILPELIEIGRDEMKTLGVKYTELIPVLVKAIQDLNAKIDAK